MSRKNSPPSPPPGVLSIGRAEITQAATRIAPHVRKTPVINLGINGFTVALKLEQLQVGGTFKARGAFNRCLSSGATQMVAASGGNHGIAVAYAAKTLGLKAHIFVPTSAPAAKVQKLQELGAQVHQIGSQYSEALTASMSFAEEHSVPISHAYDQYETLCGQGTLAREWHEQSPKLDTVLVAVGGGGLIGGMAAWYRGDVKIVAVETETCATLHRALEAGEPVDIEVSGYAVDALGAKRIGSLMFPLAQQFIARSILVSDAAVRAAQLQAWRDARIAAEPAGAAAWAALACGAYVPEPGERVGVLVCGANMDPAQLLE